MIVSLFTSIIAQIQIVMDGTDRQSIGFQDQNKQNLMLQVSIPVERSETQFSLTWTQ